MQRQKRTCVPEIFWVDDRTALADLLFVCRTRPLTQLAIVCCVSNSHINFGRGIKPRTLSYSYAGCLKRQWESWVGIVNFLDTELSRNDLKQCYRTNVEIHSNL